MFPQVISKSDRFEVKSGLQENTFYNYTFVHIDILELSLEVVLMHIMREVAWMLMCHNMTSTIYIEVLVKLMPFSCGSSGGF